MTEHQDRIELHPDFEPEPEFYDPDEDQESPPEPVAEDEEPEG